MISFIWNWWPLIIVEIYLLARVAVTEALSQELRWIDEAIARRPALADLKYRYEKVYRACEMAGKAEALGKEVYLCKEQFAELCERNTGEIVELRTQLSILLTQVEALSGQLHGDLN